MEKVEKSEKISGLGLDAYFNSSREIIGKIAPSPKKTGEGDLAVGREIGGEKESKEKEKATRGRLTNKREFERNYLEELQGSVSQDLSMPSYLLPYVNFAPNEELLIHGGSVLVRTYGYFHWEPFGKKHI